MPVYVKGALILVVCMLAASFLLDVLIAQLAAFPS